MPDSSNDMLVERLSQGESSVLAELFASCRNRLKQMVSFRMDRRLNGRVDPSDILQEAYIDATQRVDHFLKIYPQMSIYVWLREVTTQRLIDVHRKHLGTQKRNVDNEVSINRRGSQTSTSLAVHLVGHLTSPSQIAIKLELMNKLEEALDGMDAIDREVLALRHFEELTNNEVAEVLDIQKSAASNRYIRALTRLKSILAEIPGFGE